jgi:4-hydroxybutyrate CoA-transferase
VSGYLTQLDRPFYRQGLIDFQFMDLVLSPRRYADRRPKGRRQVYMTQISIPDDNGYCSFGEMIWYSLEAVEGADLVLGEIVPGLIRTYGENRVHVSQIDIFVQSDPSFKHAPDEFKKSGVSLDANEAVIAQEIGNLVVRELVHDGDVVQIGMGAVSVAVVQHLHHKRALGIHSEIIPSGVVDLVKQGVITGETKSVHKGKVVASGCMGVNEDELLFINNNPTFELYRISHVNDPRVISANDNVVAINNALAVDLSGQVASDSLGPQVYSGPGGQLDFVLGAMMSKGGRSITVLPATAREGKRSRIVPTLEKGQGVTVPRSWVDYVVTEYGIARLFGKTLRERASELIAIAHPQFQSDLREEAKILGLL